MNLLLMFCIGMIIAYLAAMVYNQGHQEHRVQYWIPGVAWVVVFVFGCGVYFILAVPKKAAPFDTREVSKGFQSAPQNNPPSSLPSSSASPSQGNVNVGDPRSLGARGMVFVNESQTKSAVTDGVKTWEIETGKSRAIVCGGTAARMTVNGVEYDFRFGEQGWIKARITPGGVISEPLS